MNKPLHHDGSTPSIHPTAVSVAVVPFRPGEIAVILAAALSMGLSIQEFMQAAAAEYLGQV